MLESPTLQFLSHLHRGGRHSYWWTSEGRQSFWWETAAPTALPGGRRNIYFGVNPTSEVPATNLRGDAREPAQVRGQISVIAALNCLFGDFDAKDFTNKAAALAHIEHLDPAPSVIIDSGGGYHGYWLLTHPWMLRTDNDRHEAMRVQSAWVTFVRADEGVKDIARVLRVPGTRNWKYDPAPVVAYIKCDLDLTYRLEALAALLPAAPAEEPREISGPQPADRATDWAQRKLADAIRMVATAAPHTRHNTMIKAARLAGGCVPHLAEPDIVRALSAAYNGEEDDREVERVILDGIAYGQAKPLAPPPTPPALVWRDGAAYCPACGGVARPSKFYDDGLFCSCQRPALVWRGDETRPPAGVVEAPDWKDDASASTTYVVGPSAPHGITTLVDVPPPPVVWFAPGFLREGSGLLVGQPNVGKTPLAAQLGLSLAGGVPWLGSIAVRPSRVLYIGCEYSRQELYPLLTESMAAMRLKVRREITDENFAYKTQDDALPDTPDAAIADLEFYISLGFNVIIIDTLTAFLPPEKFKQSVYRGDYKELQPYHRLALKHSVAILGVWHASKRESDPKLMYNGSTGMWAVPSSRISMYEDDEGRKRISSFPRLGDRTDLALTQEKGILGRRWVVADAQVAPPVQLSATERTIYQWLQRNSDKANPRTAATIAEMTGVNPNTVKTSLARMFDENLVQRGARGAYFVGSSGSSGSSETFGSFGSSVKNEDEILTQDPKIQKDPSQDPSVYGVPTPKIQKIQEIHDPTRSTVDLSPAEQAAAMVERLRQAKERAAGGATEGGEE